MRSRIFLVATATLSMRWPILLLAVLSASPGWAANPIVRDGHTIQLAGVTYRLDGIDAPELDQICIDEQADAWACGVAARDQLVGLIGGHQVRCEDQGADTTSRKRNFEPSAKGRFNQDEATAKDNRRGLWKGCFVAPQEFRHARKDGALLGGSCRTDKDREIREVLFPDHPAMPPGCSVKGKLALRARLTGNLGIYHMQGCRAYPALTKPDRWFCSEEDAQAAGFRRAYNCRANAGKPK
jgi:endonuclease YncB( thermonuclease family)